MAGKINPFPSSEFALLGFLYPGASYGYELHKKITEASGIGMVWGVKMSNLYAQLDKLERKGLIFGNLKSSDAHPARMEYSLTPAGKVTFESWLSQTVDHPRDFRQEFMVRIFFMSRYKSEQMATFIQAQTEECERWIIATNEKGDKLTRKGSFENLVYHFRSLQIQSMVDWLKWILSQLPILDQQ